MVAVLATKVGWKGSRMRGLRPYVIAAIVMLTGARAVRAQGMPTAEGAIGYAFMHDNDSDLDFPFGWMASVAGYATNWLVFVGEIGGSYRQQTSAIGEVTIKQHMFVTGPRVTMPANSHVALYGQALFGIAHGSVDVAVPGAVASRGTGFTIAPAAGVDFNFSSRRGLRFQVDSRSSRDEGETRRQLRFAAAFAFRN
jgi:hypothetical protein